MWKGFVLLNKYIIPGQPIHPEKDQHSPINEHPWCIPKLAGNICICWDSYKKLHPIGLKGCKCNRNDWPHGLLPIRDVSQTTSTKVRKLMRWHRLGLIEVYRCYPYGYRFISLHEAHKVVMFFWKKWMIRNGYDK